MRKATVALLLMFVSSLSYAQVREGNEENLQPLLQDIFFKAKQYSVYKSRVDWPALEAEVLKRNETTCQLMILSERTIDNKTKVDRGGVL